MNWCLVVEVGDKVYTQEGFMEDPFWALGLQAMQEGTPSARVGCQIGRSLDYGEVKASFTVNIICPQSTACMEQAAELVFKKATEFVNDGMTYIAPTLGPLPYPGNET